MFGSDVWLVGGHLCVLLMPYGRIVVRLPSSSETLLAIDGAAPWTYGTKQPKHWVMVPESFHDDVEQLQAWIERARREVIAHPPATAKMSKRR
jgi:TfoX/Sxy family transcriptional regulator of competence genes